MNTRSILTVMVGATLIFPAIVAFLLTERVRAAGREVTFTKDVAPIFFDKCTECHRPGEIAPMSLLSYKDARPWARSIREKVLNREMPPWDADPAHGEFSNNRRLTQKEIEVITNWVDGGSKEGNPADLPVAPTYAQGWSIGKPDVVLTVAQPYTVAASGPDEYQYFAVPTGFTEDRFVSAVEVRPGNRRIVHHLVVFVQPPPTFAQPSATFGLSPTKSVQPATVQSATNSLPPATVQAATNSVPPLTVQAATKSGETSKSFPASHALTDVDSQPGASAADYTQYRDGFVNRTKQDVPVFDDGCSLPNGGGGFRRDVSKGEPVPGILAEYLPGNRGEVLEPESAKRIPAGSVLLFQVHYSKTTGEVQKDQSSIGLIFAKSQPRTVVDTKLVFNAYFSIPPGSPNHQTTACWKLTDDADIVSLTPHMHFRGKAMEIKAIFPDGRSEVLLNVPKYKFGWQTIYYLKRPIVAPKGTRIAVTSWFDNSTENKYNPDPTRAVRWGEPTYDEMLAAFIGYSVKLDK